MPNYVHNEITFHADPETLKRIKDTILTVSEREPHGCIDFDKIIPMPTGPDFYRDGDLGAEELKKYGKNNWYDWSIKNWGTKWNAFDGGVQDLDDIGATLYHFVTAWSWPTPIFKALAKMFPEVDEIEILAENDDGSVCWRIEHGEFTYEP